MKCYRPKSHSLPYFMGEKFVMGLIVPSQISSVSYGSMDLSKGTKWTMCHAYFLSFLGWAQKSQLIPSSFLSNNKVYVELGSLVMKFSLPPFQLPTSFNCNKIVVFATFSTFSTLSNQLHLGWQQAWHWLSTNPIFLTAHVLAHPLF